MNSYIVFDKYYFGYIISMAVAVCYIIYLLLRMVTEYKDASRQRNAIIAEHKRSKGIDHEPPASWFILMNETRRVLSRRVLNLAIMLILFIFCWAHCYTRFYGINISEHKLILKYVVRRDVTIGRDQIAVSTFTRERGGWYLHVVTRDGQGYKSFLLDNNALLARIGSGNFRIDDL
jgi:hypothetical protein